MMGRSDVRKCGWVVGLCMCVMLLVSCESRDKYVGVYRADATGYASHVAIILELKANGDGLWRVISDEVNGTPVETPFTWYIKRGDLRMNTRAGGVIVGKIGRDTIRMNLPGYKALTFRKSR